MPGFGVSFNSAANALSAIQKALNTVENNIVNAGTPGYAAQRVSFLARSCDIPRGTVGGVDVSLSSTRDQYLEQSVRTQTSALGWLEQSSPMLSSLQSAFSASGDSGVPGALSSFAGSFAALAAAPAAPSARNGVIEAEATLAQLNAKIEKGGKNDVGVAADLNNSLDTLSELVNITVTTHEDGTASVLMGGETPLVIGDKALGLSVRSNAPDPRAPYPNGDAGLKIVDQEGVDVTGKAAEGKLRAFLQIRNEVVPYYLGSQTQQGELNHLAKSFASRVNTVIMGAQAAAGAAVAPLFTFDPNDDTRTAASLALASFTPDQLVAGDGGSSNAVATELANIVDPANAADLMSNGETFMGFYGRLAGKAGSDASQAAADLATQRSLTPQ